MPLSGALTPCLTGVPKGLKCLLSPRACCLQTHCALSGEQFEQFWDEEHQEWRYRDAKALDAEEAARSAASLPSCCLCQPVMCTAVLHFY